MNVIQGFDKRPSKIRNIQNEQIIARSFGISNPNGPFQ